MQDKIYLDTSAQLRSHRRAGRRRRPAGTGSERIYERPRDGRRRQRRHRGLQDRRAGQPIGAGRRGRLGGDDRRRPREFVGAGHVRGAHRPAGAATTCFDEARASAGRHIELAERGELLCVAPATANLLAKAATGWPTICSARCCSSFTGPVLVAPAMNCEMWEKPAVQRNVEQLRSDGVHVRRSRRRLAQLPHQRRGPHGRAGEDPRGDRDSSSPSRAAVATLVSIEDAMARILITSGPTRQYLDPVRYLTNASSGRMGKALAEAALAAGTRWSIVSGPVDVDVSGGGAKWSASSRPKTCSTPASGCFPRATA